MSRRDANAVQPNFVEHGGSWCTPSPYWERVPRRISHARGSLRTWPRYASEREAKCSACRDEVGRVELGPDGRTVFLDGFDCEI